MKSKQQAAEKITRFPGSVRRRQDQCRSFFGKQVDKSRPQTIGSTEIEIEKAPAIFYSKLQVEQLQLSTLTERELTPIGESEHSAIAQWEQSAIAQWDRYLNLSPTPEPTVTVPKSNLRAAPTSKWVTVPGCLLMLGVLIYGWI